MGMSEPVKHGQLSVAAVAASEAQELAEHLGRPFLVVVRDYETGREYHHGLFATLVQALGYVDQRVEEFKKDRLSNLTVSAHPLLDP